MRQFFAKVIIFSLLFFICDYALGSLFSIINSTGKSDYIRKECKEDVLIFGSSRAQYHYNPAIIEDSLQMSAFNCGESGYGIINSLGYLKMIQERYNPKLIIYDVSVHFDFEKSDNHKAIRKLKPHYNNHAVRNIILQVDPLEKFKMISLLYRYNSCWLQNPAHYTTTKYDKTFLKYRGYIPKHKSFDSLRISKNLCHFLK